MSEIKESKHQPTYLGDGVYAEHDGWHIVLRVNDHKNEPAVYLEPAVFNALVQYAHKCWDLKPIKAIAFEETVKPPRLTRREKFARAAMQGLLSSGEYSTLTLPSIQDMIARLSVQYADALIKELDKDEGDKI